MTVSLTNRKGVHPAPPVGGKLHGHPGWSEGIYERSLGGVASWTDVQGGLSTSYCESSWSTGVPLRIHHLLQQICQKTTKNGMGGRTEVDHKLSHPVVDHDCVYHRGVTSGAGIS